MSNLPNSNPTDVEQGKPPQSAHFGDSSVTPENVAGSKIRQRLPLNTDGRSGTTLANNNDTLATSQQLSEQMDDPVTDRHHRKRHLSYWKALMKPKKRIGKTPSVGQSIRAIVFASWLNILLVFIPVSWALHFAKKGDTVIFVTAFLAIIPLAKLLGFATEELALRVGETLGGLLNATLGNAVELIVSIVALLKCEIRVVQASLVGSILSNLLLVLGMCFFFGGTKFATQGFLLSASQINSSLLTISVVALLIPATFHAALSGNRATVEAGVYSSQEEGSAILKMSRGVSIIMLFIYGCSLAYQLWSHAHLYENKKDGTAAAKSVKYPSTFDPASSLKFFKKKGSKDALKDVNKEKVTDSPTEETAAGHEQLNGTVKDSPATLRGGNEAPAAEVREQLGDESDSDDDEEEEEPQISVWAAAVLLVGVTVLVAVTAEFLVSSINGLVETTPLSQEWVGLILLPIVGNAAEHVTAVTVSVKDKLDLSIGVAVGSSIQISLLVIPFIIVLGWMIGKPITLLFDPFEAVVLFLTVITVNYVVADGQSNWLEGMILICLYILIATALWFYPGSDPAAQLLTCTI